MKSNSVDQKVSDTLIKIQIIEFEATLKYIFFIRTLLEKIFDQINPLITLINHLNVQK